MGEAGLRLHASPKLPPYSIEAEQSVLGGMILDNRAIDAVSLALTAADFYRQDHQLIFDAIVEMRGLDKPVDFVTLTEHAKRKGILDEVGGQAYLGTLANDTPSAANTLPYAELVRERSLLRGLIAAGGDIAEMGYRPEGRSHAELIELAESTVHALRKRNDTGQLEALNQSQLMDRVEAYVERLRMNPGQFAGLPTGITDLDTLTTGMHPGDLVIVGGRPSMGKTSLALGIAEHVVLYSKKAAGVFSMEMPAQQLELRLLASYARIDMGRLRAGGLTDRDYDRMVSCGTQLREAPLYIDETGALTPLQLRAKARRMKQRYDVQVLVVDYVQLMTVPGMEKREQEIAEISRSLKALAKELGVTVIALSQLNRGVENRTNKRPRMADLRESGGLEQDADLVVFVYRDEVYNKDSPDKGIAEIIVDKQRNGPLGTVKAAFLGQYTRFENLAQGQLPY